MNSLKKHWTYADSAFLASGVIYLLFLYLRLHYAGLYMGHFGELKWDWLILGYYMAEAALIGSFADWFAVTAVFKVPWICRLLPFMAKHTAILPRCREGFVRGCGQMVQQEFLTKKALLLQKKQLVLLDKLLAYLEKPHNKACLQGLLTEFAEGVLHKLDTLALSRQFEGKIKIALADVKANTELDKLFKALAAKRQDEQCYEWLLQQLVALAESPAIRERVHSELQKQAEKRGSEGLWSSLKLWAAKKLDVVNVDDATDAVCRALVATAHRLQDDKQWRCWLYTQLQRVVTSVYGTKQWGELVQSLQQRALRDISLQPALQQLLDNMIKALCRPQSQEGSAVARPTILQQAIAEALKTIETDLRSDAQFKAKAEAYLQHILGLGLLQAQTMLGNIVERILQGMADERLTEMVRSKVDTDMQRIRLNGTVMGAFLGAVLYLLKCAW